MTTTTISIERLQALSDRDLMQHYRNMDDAARFYGRWNEKHEVMALLDAARVEQQRRYAVLPSIVYPTVCVETSFKYVRLTNATWTAYLDGRYADGRNGALCGVNVATGREERFEWAHLDKAHAQHDDRVTRFNLAVCG